MRRVSPAVRKKAARVRALLMDVDGVLTDGRVALQADRGEIKTFHIRDGTGIVCAHRAGLRTGLLSGRESAATARRAAELSIEFVLQRVEAKLDGYATFVHAVGLADAQIAYIGDDLMDLPLLIRVGLAAAPADAAPEVRARVDYVTRAAGGAGAVRELVELILRAQGKWSAVVSDYLAGAPPPAPRPMRQKPRAARD